MKEYLLEQYKHYFDVERYFEKLTGRENREAEIEYRGMRYAIGRALTELGFMSDDELNQYQIELLLAQ